MPKNNKKSVSQPNEDSNQNQPKNKPVKPTKKDIVSNLPEPYKSVAEKIFIHNNHNIYIAPRVNKSNKPPLYLWDLTARTYLSSLFWDTASESFKFDTRNKVTDRPEMYQLKFNGSDFQVTEIA